MLLRKMSKTWLTCLRYFNSFLVSFLYSLFTHFVLTFYSLCTHFGFAWILGTIVSTFCHTLLNKYKYVHTLSTRCLHVVYILSSQTTYMYILSIYIVQYTSKMVKHKQQMLKHVQKLLKMNLIYYTVVKNWQQCDSCILQY